MDKRSAVYISSAKYDTGWRDQLVASLEKATLGYQIEIWHDGMIPPGLNKRDETEAALERASVAILVISPAALEVETVQEEWRRLHTRSLDGRLRLVPVLFESCPWQSIEWLNGLQIFPIDGHAIGNGSVTDISEDLQELSAVVAQTVLSQENAPTNQTQETQEPDDDIEPPITLPDLEAEWPTKVQEPKTNEPRVFSFHQDRVLALAKIDERRVASGSADGTIRIWNINTGIVKNVLVGHGGSVSALALLRGSQLVSGGDDGSVRIWSPDSGEPLETTIGASAIQALSTAGLRLYTGAEDGMVTQWLSQEGFDVILNENSGGVVNLIELGNQQLLAALAPGEFHLWSLTADGVSFVKTWAAPALTNAAAFGKDRFLSTHIDGTLRLWGLDSEAPLHEYQQGTPLATAEFSPNGEQVLTASFDGTARLWDLATHEAVGEAMVHATGVDNAFFFDAGRKIATLSNDLTVCAWDTTTQKIIGEPFTPVPLPETVILAPTGDRLVAVTGGQGTLWNIRQKEQIGPAFDCNLSLGHTFSPNGEWIAAYDGQSIKILSGWTAKMINQLLPQGNLVAIDFSKDSQFLMTVTEEGRATLWQIGAGEGSGSRVAAENEPLRTACWHSESQRLVVAGSNKVQVFDTGTWQSVSQVRSFDAWTIQFSRDGRRFVTTPMETTIHVFDAETGQQLCAIDHAQYFDSSPPGLVFAELSPNGGLLSTLTDNGIAYLWDATTGQMLGQLPHSQGHNQPALTVDAVDSRHFVSGGQDGRVLLWDAETGLVQKELGNHQGSVNAVLAFDESRIISASDDKTISIWKIDRAKARPARKVTPTTVDEEDTFVNATASLSGFKSDNADGDDQLGIKEEVSALSAVVVAEQVHPPLAIGLFGDWGSGKSFFMGKMRKYIDFLAANTRKLEEQGTSGKLPFCSQVAQIDFNAWHYAESNLWASLVTRIFDGLAEYVGAGKKRVSIEERRRHLLENLETVRTLKREAEADLKEAQKKVEELAEKKKELEEEAYQQRLDWQRAARRAVDSVLAKKHASVDKTLETIGVKRDDLDDLMRTADELRNLSGQLKAHGTALRKDPNIVVLMVSVLIFLGTAWFATQIADQLLEQAAALFLPLVGVVTFAKRHLSKVQKAIALVYEAEAHVKRGLTAVSELGPVEKANLETLEEALEEADKNAANVEKKLKLAQEEEERALKAVQEAESGRRFYRFIEERSSSSDYRQHLGLITLIRRDFEQLKKLINDYAKNKAPGDVRGVERIVLYIDDLDRCEDERVVEVLQAIHLLLAIELFVVVVAVDSRWLLHALEKKYPQFGQRGRRARRLVTPQNYLEKIFQIPFELPAMRQEGFDRLVDSLIDVDAEQTKTTAPLLPAKTATPEANVDRQEKAENEPEVEQKPKPEVIPETSPKIGDEPKLENTSQVEAKPPTAQEPPTETKPTSENKASEKAEEPAKPEEPVRPERRSAADSDGFGGTTQDFARVQQEARGELRITAEENVFVKKLLPLIATPRGLKRLSNVYRLIRVLPPPPGRQPLRQINTRDYEVVLFLLAVQVGLPVVARRLAQHLRDHTSAADLQSLIDDDTTWQRMRLQNTNIAKLKNLVAALDLPPDLTPYQEWEKRVRRFSFDTGPA